MERRRPRHRHRSAALWAGERLPSATPGPAADPADVPAGAPHPDLHRRLPQEFVALAGQKADGYLARPAESIPSLAGILGGCETAAIAAGRDPAAIETAGYLLTLVDETRREALNRAKREPFVIYMMSVLADVSLRRAGLRAGAARPDRRGLAGRGLPRPPASSSPTSCSTRSCCAARARTSRPRAHGASTPRRGWSCRCSSRCSRRTAQIDELLAAAALRGGCRQPAAAVGSAGTRRPAARADVERDRCEPGRCAADRRSAWPTIGV